MTSSNDAPVTPYDGCGRCLLGVRRLSRVQGATSSPARQRDLILDAAARESGHIIGWADDWEVSGDTDPYTRPKLGPWLKDQHGPYDGLAAAAVDRIGRNVEEGLRLSRLNKEAGRLLLTADHSGWWDLDDPAQENEFTLKLFGARMEFHAIRTRNRQRAVQARTAGEVAGRPAYGFMHVRLAHGAKVDHTENEPDSAAVAREFARRLPADETGRVTVDSEAARLTRAEVFSPSDWSRVMYGKEPLGGRWSGNVIKRSCLSDASLGYLTHKGKAVLGPDGHPVRIAPGLWGRPTQSAPKARPAPHGAGRAFRRYCPLGRLSIQRDPTSAPLGRNQPGWSSDTDIPDRRSVLGSPWIPVQDLATSAESRSACRYGSSQKIRTRRTVTRRRCGWTRRPTTW